MGVLPSLETVKYVAQQSLKAAVAQAFMFCVLFAIGYVVGVVGGEEFGDKLRSGLFMVYELVMIGHSFVGFLMAMAPKTKAGDAQEQAVVTDKWTKPFAFAVFVCLLGPYWWVYYRSETRVATEMGYCLFCQWFCKLLCFVLFPREVFEFGDPQQQSPNSIRKKQ